MNLEREAKLIAAEQVRLPDLDGVVTGGVAVALPVRRLEAVYYDTVDLDLARWQITLRHRSGEDGPPWTLKLPGDHDGAALVRPEIGFEGPPDPVPAAARDLVAVYLRRRPLVEVARLRTDRAPIEIQDAGGRRLAELTDDRVAVRTDGASTPGFREVEVEVFAPDELGDRLLAAVIDRLVAAGCRTDRPVPKVVRALGRRALEPPELTVPPITGAALVGDLVCHALAGSVTGIIRHDPGVRLGEDPDAVDRLRTAAGRVRGHLRTFSSLLEAGTVRGLRSELWWLVSVVDAAHTVDVFAGWLQAQPHELPEADGPGVERLLPLVTRRAEVARATLLHVLRSARYLDLVDALVAAAESPPLRPERAERAGRPAVLTAGLYVRRWWRDLADAVAGLGDHPPARSLRKVQIRAEGCRSAAEAVAPVAGPAAACFAVAIAEVQRVLDELRDTVIAEAWLHAVAGEDPEVAVVADHLAALQRARRAELRGRWPATWAAAADEDRSWI